MKGIYTPQLDINTYYPRTYKQMLFFKHRGGLLTHWLIKKHIFCYGSLTVITPKTTIGLSILTSSKIFVPDAYL